MIIFHKVRFKNFLAAGNGFIEVPLDKVDRTIISGKNGNGKSQILDALTFALFGKTFRNINIPQLVNSINQKDCVAEVEFSSGSTEYKIVRGIAPKKFDIFVDGKLLEQDSNVKDYQRKLEEHILRFDYKAFCQVVILGSRNYVPFMRLPLAERRAIVESILDIDIFSSMNDVVKGKLAGFKEELSATAQEAVLVDERIAAQEKYIAGMENNATAVIASYETEIDSLRGTIATTTAEIERRTQLYAKVSKTLAEADIDFYESNLTTLEDYQRQITKNISGIEKNLSFYEGHNICPTCKQTISDDHRCEMKTTGKQKLDEFSSGLSKLKKTVSKVDRRLTAAKDIQTKVDQIAKNIKELRSQIGYDESQIEKLRGRIERTNEGMLCLQADRDNLAKMKTEKESLVASKKKLLEEQEYHSLAASLLKDDGVKAQIVRQYLPVMNDLINRYLAAMDFFVQFTLDGEFNESIKSRYRDKFSYDSFSEGEKMRIDLALLFVWREIARQRNRVATNILILDEVLDSSLDANGMEEVMRLLTQLGNANNIFVISHKADQLVDRFSASITFTKKKNFSEMVMK